MATKLQIVNRVMRELGGPQGEEQSVTTRIRWGFKSRRQLYLFMIWREYWQDGEVVEAAVLFSSRDWIGL